jgi:hypothetical protein
MELKELNQLEIRVVDADFHGLNVSVNVNAVTGRHYREAATRIGALLKRRSPARKTKKKKIDTDQDVLAVFEGRGAETETLCDFYAGLLKGTEAEPLLVAWDLTDKGSSVPCTVEELRKRHPSLLKDLYEFCLTVDRPKSPETRITVTSRTISDSTVAITPIPDTQTDASPTM